jgi:hypothetical protein
VIGWTLNHEWLNALLLSVVKNAKYQLTGVKRCRSKLPSFLPGRPTCHGVVEDFRWPGATQNTMLKGWGDIGSSPLWRGARILWMGAISPPSTLPRTYNGQGGKCSPVVSLTRRLPVLVLHKKHKGRKSPPTLQSLCRFYGLRWAFTWCHVPSVVFMWAPVCWSKNALLWLTAVCVTLRVVMVVRTPAIADDRSAVFDPCIYNGHQSFGGSVRNGN